MRIYLYAFVCTVCILAGALSTSKVWAAVAAVDAGNRTVVPKVGVFITADDIQRARQLAQTKQWAKTEAWKILSEAAVWVEKPDSWYQEIMPPRGSTFAYGQTGCPIDGSAWPPFGGGGVADFSRPFILKCPNGQLINVNDPQSPYYDTGKGITIKGVKYWLRGVWNAYVVEQLVGRGGDVGIVYSLAYAYALTGEPKYAQKALVIMDALATLSPTTIGPRDFTSSETADQGRLHWLTSIVFRTRLDLINAYDIVYQALDKDLSSPTYKGRTLQQNIEKGLFLDYVFNQFDLRYGRLNNLQNHEADSVRGMLGVGLLLGIPQYITWGINDVVRFIDNTIDRDGMYYETSFHYANFMSSVFLSMAEMAYNYSPHHYESSGFPERSTLPYQANFYDHPKLQKYLVGARDRVDAAGFKPGIGDGSASRANNLATVADRQAESVEILAMEQFAMRTSDTAVRDRYAQMLLSATGGDPDNRRSGRWALFHTQDQPVTNSAATKTKGPIENESALLAGAGIAFLRSGSIPNLRAAVMRGGSTLTHGHDDPLGLLLYGRGFDLNTEIGYGISGSPVHWGWGSRGVAHNLVVVNKGLNRNDVHYQVGPGADTLAFVNQAGVSGVEMDARQMFMPVDGVSQYQRGVWQVDISPTDSYWVDIFRITGGKTHDYSFHAGTEYMTFDGVKPESLPGIWTLYGLDNPNATFDEPKKSWGERIIPGEGIKDLGIASEGVRQQYWPPTPGNGYGFIYDLKGDKPAGKWNGTWLIPGNTITRLSLTMLADGGAQTVYRGFGPDLSGKNRYAYVVARREADTQLQSRFVSVIQVHSGQPLITNTEELVKVTGSDQSVVLRLAQAEPGVVDYILSNPKPGMMLQARDGQILLETDALFALVRVKGTEVMKWHIVGGSKLQYDNWQANLPTAVYKGSISTVDYAHHRFTSNTPLPNAIKGSTIVFNNPAYAKNTAYTVSDVKQLPDGTCVVELGDSAFELGSTMVATLGSGSDIGLTVPLPTAFNASNDTRTLQGKLVVNGRDQSSGIISRVTGMNNLKLTKAPTDWRKDDTLVVYDIQAGDTYEILSQAYYAKDAANWVGESIAPVKY